VRRLTPPLLKIFAELFYPSNCVGCGLPQAPGILLCDDCKVSSTRIKHPFCSRCSRPFDGQISKEFCCPNCEDQPLAFDCAVSVWRADGVLRDLIHRFKYEGKFYLRRVLAEFLLDAIRDDRITASPVDAIVPVPLHPARRRERGFNQAAALAEILSRRTAIPVFHCLQRRCYTQTQTQFDRAERRRNLRNAFALRKNSDVTGKNLVLLDDVLTTGSTLHECALVLRKAEVASVRAITVARG
jgi:competence protein ComFC